MSGKPPPPRPGDRYHERSTGNELRVVGTAVGRVLYVVNQVERGHRGEVASRGRIAKENMTVAGFRRAIETGNFIPETRATMPDDTTRDNRPEQRRAASAPAGDEPDTKIDAYKAIRDAGEDVSLRFRVAALIADEPMTTHEIGQRMPEKSANAIRPRVNELVRMECVERRGKRTNPSGHEAYVHHITPLGLDYLKGGADPEPAPPLAEYRRKVVGMARKYLNGEVDKDFLKLAVDQHDSLKQRMDPDWDPEDPLDG